MLRELPRGPCCRAARERCCTPPVPQHRPRLPSNGGWAMTWRWRAFVRLQRSVTHQHTFVRKARRRSARRRSSPLPVPSTSHSALKRGRAILRRVRHVQPDDAPLPLAGAQHQPLRPEEGQGHECPTACCRGNAPTSNVPVGRYTRVSRCLSSMHEWAFAPLASAGPHGSGDGVPLLVSTRSIFACRFGRACLNRRASSGLVLLQELCSPQGFGS